MIYGGLLQSPTKVTFQYNPATLQHAFTPRSAPQTGQNQDPYQVKGQPVETITLEAEFDATDQLELPDQNPTAVRSGVYPQLAALESMMRPVPTAPANSPYTVLVWGTTLVVPVLLTSCVVTEEAFDAGLNPIRAKASLVMRVLTTEDFPLTHPGRKVYEDYLKKLEELANLVQEGVRSGQSGTRLMSTP